MGHIPDWMPEHELAMLQAQPKASPSQQDNEKLAMQIFRDNLPLAAEIIGELATSGEKESTRLNASKYIVERCLGRTPESQGGQAQGDAWDDLFGSVVREPTAEERMAGTKVSRL